MSCKKKIFHSPKEAKRMRGSRVSEGKRMRVYWCKTCRGYHLTKMIKTSHYF